MATLDQVEPALEPPTVTGGRMLIVYFLPDGAVRWGPRQA